jgi:molybdopterin molybdotransferase
MISVAEAQQLILSLVHPLPSEPVTLSNAWHRYLAQPILSPLDLPGFDNSAMDGYAVQAADVATASPENPVHLAMAGRIPAGSPQELPIRSGACARVFTGSLIPPGADAVAIQEDTRADPDHPDVIAICERVVPGENIRRRGRDMPLGEVVASPGQCLTLSRLSLLSALGFLQVPVCRQPRLALLSTGSELVEPGQPLEPGQIYESNRLGLAAGVRLAGGGPVIYPLVPDRLEATRDALDRAFQDCDGVVSTGGVSVGDYDWVKSAFTSLGGQIRFWKVAVKPGKPFALGTFHDRLWFGLPGNPASALVTFALFVRPAILRWQGATQCELPSQPAVLAEPVANPGERPHFLRVVVDGADRVHVPGLQASHALHSFADSNALLELPPGVSWPAGTPVRILPWPE